MIGVDTNVLVRFLAADDERQYRIVYEFFEARSADDPAFISSVTLAESIWVLRKSYGLSFDEIVDGISLFLDSDDFVVEAREPVDAIRKRSGDPSQLTDFLIAHLGAQAGCSHTVTLDRKAARKIPSMTLLA